MRRALPNRPITRPPISGGLRSLVPAGGVLSGLLLLMGACSTPEPPPSRPPVILLTVESLRADLIGYLGADDSATPSLDMLAADAHWAGVAVASSSRTATAGASLLTGLPPWHHQLLLPDDVLPPEAITLAEALGALGYPTSGYSGGDWLHGKYGFQQGFDFFRTLRKGRGARSHLRSLSGDPELVWIHLSDPSPPWLRRDWLFEGTTSPRGLPEEITARQLEPWAAPEVPPPAALRRQWLALYRNNVALADVFLGRFVEDLRNSGHWRESLLVVVGVQGLALGEEGWVGQGGGLTRAALEVPVVIKLPDGSEMADRLPDAGARVAACRLWATLVEGAGGTSPPGVGPSLLGPAPTGIRSEIYGLEGENHFSWLQGDHQLVWRSRFAPEGRPPAASSPRAFRLTPPLTGGFTVRTRLHHWPPGGGRLEVENPALEQQLVQALPAAWSTFLSEESSPARWTGERIHPR